MWLSQSRENLSAVVAAPFKAPGGKKGKIGKTQQFKPFPVLKGPKG